MGLRKFSAKKEQINYFLSQSQQVKVGRKALAFSSGTMLVLSVSLLLFALVGGSTILLQSLSNTTAGTRVGISGTKFTINGEVTHAGRQAEGMLLNSRMINAIFDDENNSTRSNWNYSSTGWNPDKNTNDFIAQLPNYSKKGLTAVTIGLQGGAPRLPTTTQPWNVSAFNSDGSLKTEWKNRLNKVIDAANRNGIVVIVSLFYQAQDQRLNGDTAVRNAVINAVDFLNNKENVLLEIANESDHSLFNISIIKGGSINNPGRVHELILLAKNRSQGKLKVSTSLLGGRLPSKEVVKVSDFITIHGNGQTASQVGAMVDSVKAMSEYKAAPKPILFNEDSTTIANMNAAVSKGASWGYYDFKGFQSVPANWSINTSAKNAFFDRVFQLTGGPTIKRDTSSPIAEEETVDVVQSYFNEKNGLVVMEVESQPPASSVTNGVESKWVSQKNVPGYTGSSYYTWKGQDFFNTPNKGTMTYKIKINSPGKYNMRIHSYAPSNTRSDLSNDVWTKINSDPWRKTYSNTKGRWSWTTIYDISETNRPAPSFNLAAGEHTLLVAGRSIEFGIDRIVLYKDGVNGTDLSLPQSEIINQFASKPPEPVTTNPPAEQEPTPTPPDESENAPGLLFEGVTNNQTVSGTLKAQVVPMNVENVSGVSFYVGNKFINREGSTAPYSLGGDIGTTPVGWNTKELADGDYQLRAILFYGNGQTIEKSINIKISNSASIPPSTNTSNPSTSNNQTVQAENGIATSGAKVQNDPQASEGKALKLNTNGSRVSYTFTVPSDGNYSIGGTLKSQDYQGSAEVAIYLDGRQITTKFASSNGYNEIDLDNRFFKGGSKHTIAFEYINDLYGGSATADRDVWIDTLYLRK